MLLFAGNATMSILYIYTLTHERELNHVFVSVTLS